MPELDRDAIEELRTTAVLVGRRGTDSFPWRTEPTWYRTLVAEVLLQHTPSNRVSPIFDVLVERWPTFKALGEAGLSELETLLKPLGLQRRRARSLVEMASRVVQNWNGRPPSNAAKIESLPGVGRYTAAVSTAVAAEAPAVYVDGGMARLLARYFGLDRKGRAAYDRTAWNAASQVMSSTDHRYLAWGLADLAREVCRPVPSCEVCPLRARCVSVSA